jgi:hypothetical protein
MREFHEIDNTLKVKLLEAYFRQEIQYSDIESVYNIDPKTLKNYILSSVSEDWERYSPTPQKAKYEGLHPYKKLAIQMLVSLGLLVAMYFAGFLLEHIGIDPYTNELISNVLRACGITIICMGFVDWLVFWKDPELFGYMESTVQSETSFETDFKTLTPFERCLILSARFSLYALSFSLAFLSLNQMLSVSK